MGWLRRILRWFTGLGPEDAQDVPGAAPPSAAPGPLADPYFAATAIPPIKKSKTLGLDAGAFLPILRDEIKQAAKGQALFVNPWFGRQDRIPPADDLRTNLIDRAMVTHGLITPEDLAEIHSAGEEMEGARPTLEGIAHQAAMAGEAAVESDRDARARLKALKKQEAARRREERRCGPGAPPRDRHHFSRARCLRD